METYEAVVWGEPSLDTVVALVGDEKRGSRNQAMINDDVGGSGANTASSLSLLGVNTALIGFLGSDQTGQNIEAELRSRRISLIMGRTPTNRRTVSLARSDGTRTMYGTEGDQYSSSEDLTEQVRLLRCNCFHVSLTSLLRSRHSLIYRTIEHLRACGAVISMDAGNDVEIRSSSSEIPKIFNQIQPDIVFANEEEADALSSTSLDLRSLRMLVIKKGSSPCEIQQKDGESLTVPIPRKTVAVDTTGAGDAFAAGMLGGLIRGLSPTMSSTLGHLLASACIREIGATIRDKSAIDAARQFLEKNSRTK
jgi:sugar/nucleoside kinase (ribokinase family)